MKIGISEVQNKTFTNLGSSEPSEDYSFVNLQDKNSLKKLKYISPSSPIAFKVEFDRQLVSFVGLYGSNAKSAFPYGYAILFDSVTEGEWSYLADSAETGNGAFNFVEAYADSIQFVFPPESIEIGYIWIGQTLKLSIEDFQITFNSDDDAEISRGNGVQSNDSYEHDSLTLTTIKEGYLTQRAKFNKIFESSYADPRPIILDLKCTTADLHYYAIFDSGNVKFNSYFLKDELYVNATIGIREVN